MEPWIIIAIAAAFLQNLRSALQKHLKGTLTTSGVTFSRFVFALPVCGAVIAFLAYNQAIPEPNLRFLAFMSLGGISQILATALLVYLFGLRNFAVGTTLSKTETIQAAIFGIIVLGDQISIGAGVGIILSMFGVILLSTNGLGEGGFISKSSLIGLASGAAFAVSGVSYRAASLSLPSGDFLVRATLTLFCVLIFQTLVMALWLALREAGQLQAVIRSWRISMWVGVTGGFASLGWFSAMTLQNAAYVKALGQIEILFTIAAGVFFFKEKLNTKEIVGISLASIGILILVLWR